MSARRVETRPRAHIEHSAGVVIRLAAFVVATLGILAIPVVLVATATGHVPHQTAVIALGIAMTAIVAAAIAVRPFDPLR